MTWKSYRSEPGRDFRIWDHRVGPTGVEDGETRDVTKSKKEKTENETGEVSENVGVVG